jgi:PilZ domain
MTTLKPFWKPFSKSRVKLNAPPAAPANPTSAFNSSPSSESVCSPVCRPDRATNHDTSADRRRHRRAPLDVLANRFQQGYPYLCRATDISRKGMRLYTFNEPQLAASHLSGLQFQLPGCSDVITASAEVVFEDAGSGVVGIRFLHLSKRADAAIDGYLDRTCAA